jgi:hypothetical protein
VQEAKPWPIDSRRWRPVVATLVVVAVITIAAGMIMPFGLDLAEQVPNPFSMAGLEWLRHLTRVRSSIAFLGGRARADQRPTATAMRCRCGPGTASVAAAWGR